MWRGCGGRRMGGGWFFGRSGRGSGGGEGMDFWILDCGFCREHEYVGRDDG